MANQIVISSGAKVRNLNGVLTGTTGVVDALGINVANGIPQLDGSGKILVSQLPNSVMEYKGTWNAATNTPTLVNGTGNQGDVYLCNVAGTVNFGAGAITFAVGDQAIYSGTIWQKAGGSTGTVTSVAVTETGDALTITGSPITTSGTINIGFAGISGQYVNGAGGLTTFPTLITSIGLSMPSAFSVANSPLTANGTIAVTGAGVASQYIRGDGTLANFPTSGGGGSSVSYYLNGSVNQGTFAGNTYYEMSKVPVIGAGTNFTINANGYITQFITDANDPSLLEIPAGNWNFEMYFSASSGGGTPSFYVELYKYNGTTFTLIASSSAAPEGITNGTAIDLYTTALAVPTTALTLTDRLAIRVYVTHSGRTITLYTENSNLCQVITTFSTGITALNGLTAQVQYLATGTSGTDFNISSTTATHTFNLPVASATNTGKLSSTDWSTFNSKQNTITLTTTGSSGDATLVGATLNIPNYGSALSGYVPYTGATANVDLDIYNMSAAYYKSTNGYVMGQGSTVGLSGSFTVIGATPTSLNIVISNTKTFLLTFPSTSRTYTYPDATGTLALTSDLSSYLPLTGGTLTGALNINIGGAGGTGLNVASDSVIFRANTGVGSPRQLVFSSGGGTTTLIEAKGYGASYNTDLSLKTYNSSGTGFDVFFATSAGNVGIGTSSPLQTAANRIVTTINGTNSAILNLGYSGNLGAYLYTDNTNYSELYSYGQLAFVAAGSQPMTFSTTGGERMRIASGGNVGIGVAPNTGSYRLYVKGNGGIIGEGINSGDSSILSLNDGGGLHFGAITSSALKFFVQNNGTINSTSVTITLITSDRESKTDIKDYDKGLAEVLEMKPRYYKYKDNLEKQEIGFIAQEIDEALEGSMIDGVIKNEETGENYKTYKVEWFPLLVKSIQELEARIKQLENK